MSAKEYQHQRVIRERDYKFNCPKEECPLYPCYAQWFCERLSLEGKMFLGIEGACVAKKIISICEANGKKSTTWEAILLGLGEKRDIEEDVRLKNAEGEIPSFKRTLIGIEKDHNSFSPQMIGRGVNRFFRNIWLVYVDKLTVERNLKAYGDARKNMPAWMFGEGAQRHSVKKGI